MTANVVTWDYPLNADDRRVVDDIQETANETLKITRALSVSLIGKSNGTTIDPSGGRIGRLERFVWWLFSGLVVIGLWLLGTMIARVVK